MTKENYQLLPSSWGRCRHIRIATAVTLVLISIALILKFVVFASSGDNSFPFSQLKWTRHSSPLLQPELHSFYSFGIYNPSVVLFQDMFWMIFRASNHSTKWTSTLGLASSLDGVNFTVDSTPLIVPEHTFEAFGVEDPRLTALSDSDNNAAFFLTYVCNNNHYNESHICTAEAPSPRGPWVKIGVVTWPDRPGSWSFGNRKAASVLGQQLQLDLGVLRGTGVSSPQKVWLMYFLGEQKAWHTCIGLAFSTDRRTWEPFAGNPLVCPRKDCFDSQGVEPGAPALLVDGAILLQYNGWNDHHVHCSSYLVLALDGVTVLERPDKPLFCPSLPWERVGVTANITFAEGLLQAPATATESARWLLYYGAADERVGLAEGK